MVRTDERRAEKLRQVGRRIKNGSSMVTPMPPPSAPLTSSASTAVGSHEMTDRESQRLEQLGAEARYHRQRLDLYRARLYGGRALSLERLEEFERASDAAAARLGQAREAASPARRRG